MRNEIKTILAKLKEVQKKVQGYAEKAALNNNEERAEELETELGSIEAAIVVLEEIE